MIALCNETVRCLEDNIVSTPAEADMAMIMGIGFPTIPWWSMPLHRPNRPTKLPSPLMTNTQA